MLRATLLEVAESEVAAHGSTHVSLRSIAKRANVSHAAPAYHFGDKQGLFTALAIDGFAALSARMRDVLAELGNAPAVERIQGSPVALARMAPDHVNVAVEGSRAGYQHAGADLRGHPPPDAVEEVGNAQGCGV